MGTLRTLLLTRRRLALLLVVLAVAVRALVPAGFMPGGDAARTLSLAICTDGSGVTHQSVIAIALPAKPGDGGAEHRSTKAHAPCAFSALSFAALGGADGLLLAAALAFALALGFAATPRLLLRQAGWLRPPLRGPPALV